MTERDEGVEIRAARDGELDAVLALARAGGVLEKGVEESFGSFLVAARGARIVGSCGLEPYDGDALLRTVVVANDARGLGLGRQLVSAALDIARSRGVRDVYLLTTTARDFFAGLGFQIAVRDEAPEKIRGSWEFASGCPSSATFMKRAP